MFVNGILFYILAAQYKTNQKNVLNLFTPKNKKNIGWSNFLKLINAGTVLYNIENIQVQEGYLRVVRFISSTITKRCSI